MQRIVYGGTEVVAFVVVLACPALAEVGEPLDGCRDGGASSLIDGFLYILLEME